MKKILLTCPSTNIHGGIRIIFEWANGLARLGHDVTLQIWQTGKLNFWVEIDPKVKIVQSTVMPQHGFDIIVATTPALANHLQNTGTYAKKFYLLQMNEVLFHPGNRRYVDEVRRSYKVDFPIIGISKWVEEEVRMVRGDKKMYYVGNGVSDDFCIGKKDEGLTVLVEGWGGYPGNVNQAKDVSMLAPRVAEVLKKEYGAKIIAFSQFPLNKLEHVAKYNYILDEYHEAPYGADLVRLYQRPTFMLKASVYDARSCAPVEAMKCGTVTVRAIERGDDDLIHEYNCLRCKYNYAELLHIARQFMEMSEEQRRSLVNTGLYYAANALDWVSNIAKIEKILLNG